MARVCNGLKFEHCCAISVELLSFICILEAYAIDKMGWGGGMLRLINIACSFEAISFYNNIGWVFTDIISIL